MKNKKLVALTALLCLLPMVFGLILWERLPEQMPTHFGANNEPDGWSSKPFAVFGLPLIVMGLHLLCVFGTRADPKYDNINRKIMNLVLWICPLISSFVGGLMYAYALGQEVRFGFFVSLLIGVVFVIVGNYLPKSRQNYTMGIKIPWTIDDSENWNATHRFAGRLWMVAGVLMIVMAWFEQPWVFLPVVLLMVFAPIVYSYLFYRRKTR
ncbi:MAG: SdpI family protein [Eubacteriales bacterium]|nr:SdpI family protein [Eubacteriales bacterium]